MKKTKSEKMTGGTQDSGTGKKKKNIQAGFNEFLGIHKTGMELIKTAHKIDSSAIPLCMINAVIQVSNAYLGLFLTARLIDSLLASAFEHFSMRVWWYCQHYYLDWQIQFSQGCTRNLRIAFSWGSTS